MLMVVRVTVWGVQSLGLVCEIGHQASNLESIDSDRLLGDMCVSLPVLRANLIRIFIQGS